MRRYLCLVLFVFAVVLSLTMPFSNTAVAKIVPGRNTNVKYFYVFGPDGDKLLGAEDNQIVLYVDVPAEETGSVSIAVYDPDTGGHKDYKASPDNDWDTITEFSVYGEGLIEKKQFGEGEYNRDYFLFGPYPRTKGEKVGGIYRFKLVAQAVSGNDANLFMVEVKPDSAEAFSENITFRLAKNEGDKMYFYPEVPGGTEYIIVSNYDLDINGGRSILQIGRDSILEGTAKTSYKINDSETGQWRQTRVPIRCEDNTRLRYVITKGTQKYAHAGLKLEDDKGYAIPIYFTQGKARPARPRPRPIPEKPKIFSPKPSAYPDCNKFTFDATDSYDVDNQNLSFLWEFGDGETSTEAIVTHIYEKGGEYTVRLTAKDDSGLECDTATIVQTLKVNMPPKADFTSPETGCTGDAITVDASATTDDTSEEISYNWDFGDGTKAEGITARKVYDKGGRYTITLAADDNEDTACSTDIVQKTVRINTPPVADAGGDIDICLESLDEEYRVVFDGSNSRDADNDTLSYSWDFGDGSTASEKK